MKKYMVVLFLLAGTVLAQTKISIQPDNGTAIYRAGETVRWNVYLEKDGLPFNGPVDYEVKKGGLTAVGSGTLDMKDGKASCSASRNDPGALLMQLKLDQGKWDLGKQMGQYAAGGALFDCDKIMPSAEEPPDFDAFWQSKLEELAAVPMNVKLEKVEHAKVDLWKISMDNIRGTHIYGYIAKPKNAQGKLPACANFEGAGVRAASPDNAIQQAVSGWLSLHIIAHSIEAYREPEFYEQLGRGELNGYSAFGKEDREKCYFLRMLLATVRCVDYLAQRSDWDGKVLRVNGGSQGGWQAIAAAALNPKVNLVTANVVAGSDHTGRLIGRDSGWPKIFWQEKNSIETSKYFDTVFFARRIRCPALVGVGAIDPVCPPEGICAMYNQLAGPKRLLVMATAAHGSDGHQPWRNLLTELDAAMRNGQPLTGF